MPLPTLGQIVSALLLAGVFLGFPWIKAYTMVKWNNDDKLKEVFRTQNDKEIARMLRFMRPRHAAQILHNAFTYYTADCLRISNILGQCPLGIAERINPHLRELMLPRI